MAVATELSIGRLALLAGLSFLFGLAFERFYWHSHAARPGGVRTFPLLAIAGGLLYAMEPHYLTAFAAGLLVLGLWLYPYYKAEIARSPGEGGADGVMVPVCNLIAYILGPLALSQPEWLAVAVTVAAVLLLRARHSLHALARRIPSEEIFTLVQFLVLIGVILPLLPRTPVTSLTSLTPFQVWLAVVVVCSISYASYLLQRYVSPKGSVFFAALLGGMYSSTATTVVLARRMRTEAGEGVRLRSGIVLATAVMYARIEVVVAIFNRELAISLAPWLASLAGIGVVIAVVLVRAPGRSEVPRGEAIRPRNPLEISAAAVFAVLFVVISIVTAWIKHHLGSAGVYGLAAVVGVTDIDPFVLSVARGGQENLGLETTRAAILIAASSNNVLKAVYAVSFGGWRDGKWAVVGLVVLALAGVAAAVLA
jgi:uncharacterized membrane protein (DUF4010 family)